ncbi:MAG: hypothetical protein QF612_05980 [Candidatus Thalassarchaeaceae archaeon]|jgi:hypothetical protein|nr:hypothetical protein [Candidatus Thalassarchaeaceae archaeon]
MQALGSTPFEHALALAWFDDRMTTTEFRQLDALQTSLNLSDSERASIEADYEKRLAEGTAPRGNDANSLAQWIDAVRALSNVHEDVSSVLARRLGGTALRTGLTRDGWKAANDWLEQLGLTQPFAEGCWLVGGPVPALSAVPLALAPVADSLGLLG